MMKFEKVISLWGDEIISTLEQNRSYCIGLFDLEGNTLYINEVLSNIVNSSQPSENFINPTFRQLTQLETSETPIFKGFITIGDNFSINTSIYSYVFRKNDQILVVGGIDAAQITEQNTILHQLNQEITTLQRELIKEKLNLEKTLTSLEKANKQLNILNADKDRYISILAHDLKNSFNSILGFSSLLYDNLEKYDTHTIRKQLSYIKRVAKSTYHLLEDILLWAQIKYKNLSIQKQEFNVYSEFLSIVEFYNELAIDKNIRIFLLGDENITITSDLNVIKTVLRNLLSNAIKFSYENGIILVRYEVQDDLLKVTISDNGVGISRENQLKIWDDNKPFSTSGTMGEKGTGYGLSTCKNLIEQLNGKIWVESIEEKGSDFSFVVPIS